MVDAESVLSFWLGELDDDGLAAPAIAQRWFAKDEAFDARILRDFEPTWTAIMDGHCQPWLESPRGRLAYVIVLDQLSRNMFRGTSRAFAADPRALGVAIEGIDRGDDLALRGQARIFLYMPLMHAEDLAAQERCVGLFTAFRDASSGRLRQVLDSNLDFAIRHRDIIQRWGRFPHRNTVLDRTSTAAELDFLREPGSSF